MGARWMASKCLKARAGPGRRPGGSHAPRGRGSCREASRRLLEGVGRELLVGVRAILDVHRRLRTSPARLLLASSAAAAMLSRPHDLADSVDLAGAKAEDDQISIRAEVRSGTDLDRPGRPRCPCFRMCSVGADVGGSAIAMSPRRHRDYRGPQRSAGPDLPGLRCSGPVSVSTMPSWAIRLVPRSPEKS